MSAPHLSRDEGGARWFLDGRPLRCGDSVEVRVSESAWLLVRWELEAWTAGGGSSPVLYRWVPDDAQGETGVSLTIRAGLFDLRWPS